MTLLSIRAAVVLLISAVVGIVATVLALQASASHRNLPVALLVGGAAAGGTLTLANSLLTS